MKLKKVLDKIPRPPGAIPARAQTWLLAGLTAVIVIALLALPGQPPGLAGQEAGIADVAPGGPPGAAPDLTAVEGAAGRIRDEAARSAELRMRDSLGLSAYSPDGLPSPPEEMGANPSDSGADDGYPPPPSVEDRIREEERLRRYESLRAPVLVRTVRGQVPQVSPEPPVPEPDLITVDPIQPLENAAPDTPPPVPSGHGDRLREGEFIEAVLTSRLAGQFTGPVNAMVSADVWDSGLRRVVVPRGTRAIGQASRVESWEQSRLAVTFHRLLLADGRAVELGDSPGLNQIGETGLRDIVNRHYPSAFLAAGAVGVLAGLSQAVSPQDMLLSRMASVRASAGAGLSSSAERILDRYLNRLPRITVREGHRIRIYLTSDVWIPRKASPAVGGALSPMGGNLQ